MVISVYADPDLNLSDSQQKKFFAWQSKYMCLLAILLHTHTHIHAHTHTRTRTHTHAHTHTYTRGHAHIHTYTLFLPSYLPSIFVDIVSLQRGTFSELTCSGFKHCVKISSSATLTTSSLLSGCREVLLRHCLGSTNSRVVESLIQATMLLQELHAWYATLSHPTTVVKVIGTLL